ncbi:hypothetical protein Fmac_010003 [Flemingia macrophylla]|uniref:Uncharacterized protein n=1 Tax=Flemingia macrophylla TaxID=520843 RepID=A0ABD1N354_9FABA
MDFLVINWWSKDSVCLKPLAASGQCSNIANTAYHFASTSQQHPHQYSITQPSSIAKHSLNNPSNSNHYSLLPIPLPTTFHLHPLKIIPFILSPHTKLHAYALDIQ